MLAHRASYGKKAVAQQIIPLVPGYRTALSSRPVNVPELIFNVFISKYLHFVVGISIVLLFIIIFWPLCCCCNTVLLVEIYLSRASDIRNVAKSAIVHLSIS